MSRTKDEAVCELPRTCILSEEMHQPWTNDRNWVMYYSPQSGDVAS